MNRKLNVQRTKGAIVFEIVIVVLLLAVWGIIAWLISRAPDIVPTHFGPSGQPDAYGPPTRILVPCVVITLVTLALLFSPYFPKATLNMPFYQKEGNPRQDRLAVLLTRVLTVFMLVLLLLVAVSSLVLTSHSIVPVAAVMGAMILTCIVFSVLMYKAK